MDRDNEGNFQNFRSHVLKLDTGSPQNIGDLFLNTNYHLQRYHEGNLLNSAFQVGGFIFQVQWTEDKIHLRHVYPTRHVCRNRHVCQPRALVTRAGACRTACPGDVAPPGASCWIAG